ncbi:MAG: hypothetical protein ACRERU_18070, partial [Methylococcales bacterium]
QSPDSVPQSDFETHPRKGSRNPEKNDRYQKVQAVRHGQLSGHQRTADFRQTIALRLQTAKMRTADAPVSFYIAQVP